MSRKYLRIDFEIRLVFSRWQNADDCRYYIGNTNTKLDYCLQTESLSNIKREMTVTVEGQPDVT